MTPGPLMTGKKKTAALRCKIFFQLPADIPEFKQGQRFHQVITAMSRCFQYIMQIMEESPVELSTLSTLSTPQRPFG